MIPASGDMSELPPAMQGMRRRRFVDKDGDTFYATGTFRHIRLEWAGASIVFRNEDADRIAALILAVRPEPFSEARITVIPDEAVEAARAAYLAFPKTRGMNSSSNSFRAALEAATPHLMAHVADYLEGRMNDREPESSDEAQYLAGYADAVARLLLWK